MSLVPVLLALTLVVDMTGVMLVTMIMVMVMVMVVVVRVGMRRS